ncbi:MAG: hypothetical protein ABIN37_05405, partial [Burkholderiaceae bacterium]
MLHTLHSHVIQHKRAAQGAVHPCEFTATDAVLEHLVPSQNAFGIGACVAVYGHAEHDIVAAQPGGLAPGLHPRAFQRRDAVAAHPA